VIIPVVLAGGNGSRLWPLSTSERPKQFCRLLGRWSMFQQTLVRASRIGARPMVVCAKAHIALVQEQAELVGVPIMPVVEPDGRNTAAAILAAAVVSVRNNEDPTLCVIPSDHWVEDDEKWLASIREAASGTALIRLLGVTPTADGSQYGHIVPKFNGFVGDFVEKPNAEDQAELVARGALWNVGVFIGKAQHFLKVGLKCAPPVYNRVIEAVTNSVTRDGVIWLHADYAHAPALQWDRAVIEKIPDYCSVTVLRCGWSDIGSLRAFIDVGKNQDKGDYKVGQFPANGSEVVSIVTTGPTVQMVTEHALTVICVADQVIVCDAGKEDQIALKADKTPIEDPRPWGSHRYVGADTAGRWRVKRLIIEPNNAISLQTHKHRSETWVVLSGVARVTVGDKVLEISENQSVHIPAGVRHRVENTQRNRLEILEIQTGNYFGEDDIVRFSDLYGRV
jgi:mannose-1-phosphate guanylyltransferase/mannose-6-phosphate isomerase